MIGSGSIRHQRPVDVLLLAIGINDLDFSGIITSCATPTVSDCVHGSGIDAKLSQLPHKFSLLNQALLTKTLNIGEIYVTDYPRDVFKGGGCGLLDLLGEGIDANEGDVMSGYGGMLNAQIEFAARAYGWNYINKVSGAFANNPYCSSQPYFRHFETSWVTQGNEKGTAHPSINGQNTIAELLRSAVVMREGFVPYRHTQLVIDAIKFGTVPSAVHQAFDVTVFNCDEDTIGRSVGSSVTQQGVWMALPAATFTFEQDMYLAPVPPRFPTRLGFMITSPQSQSTLPVTNFVTTDYGTGSHEASTPLGQISVRYHVTSTAPPLKVIMMGAAVHRTFLPTVGGGPTT